MKKWIVKKFGARDERVHVLYDRPCEKYYILSEKERQKVLNIWFLDLIFPEQANVF